MEESDMTTILRTTTTFFRATADASFAYQERTGIEVARSYSSSDVGNLAAVTKNSTFQSAQFEPVKGAEKPRSVATAILAR
jgi:hypothetical protein